MATFLASALAGTGISFLPGVDVLQFDAGSAADLIIQADGPDLLVGLGPAAPVRLWNLRQADLFSSSIQFTDGSLFRLGHAGTDFLFGFDGDDYIDGVDGGDALDGGAGNDRISAGPGPDHLQGGPGQDTLSGGGGQDVLDGGEGDDTYIITDVRARIIDASGTDHTIVGVSHVKLPAAVETRTYVGGAKPLPYWIDALLPDAASGRHFANLLGGGKTMGFVFPAALPAYATPADGQGYSGFNALQQAFARTALDYVSTVIDLQFTEVFDASAPHTIALGNNLQTASTAYAYLPAGDPSGSDVYLGGNTPGNLAPADGSYAALTLIHELGHALGLEHPVAGGSDLPYLPTSEDATLSTVMSYNDDPAQYHAAYRPLDIAALQYLYGPSPRARAGNDVYVVDAVSSLLVWDGGGIDSLSASTSSLGATLSLEPGDWGWVGTQGASITSAGQVTVNFGTVLENLFGGSGPDHLTGNAIGNGIDGGAGDDTILGGDGDDSLVGGAGADQLAGGPQNDTLRGGWLADTLAGGEGNDFLNAGKGDDLLSGGAGDDRLIGALDNDTLQGDVGDDLLDGSPGDDRLLGGPDADTLHGGDGSDVLSGGHGDDQLDGGAGDDTLAGGLGVDLLQGGADADQFLFRNPLDPAGGLDTVEDLEPGRDIIALSSTVFSALAGNLGQRIGPGIHLHYDALTGLLAYDADGAGPDQAIGFARIGTASHPTSLGDIFLVLG